MDSLDQTFGDGRWGLSTVAGAAVLVTGLFLVGVGSLSMLSDAFRSLAVGSNPLRLATVVTGLALPIVPAIAVGVLGGRARGRSLLVGLALAYCGVAAAWIVLPSGWAGAVTPSLVLVAALYLAGVAVLLGGFFDVVLERQAATAAPTAPGTLGRSDSSPMRQPAASDGGTDDGLTFLNDDEDDTDRPR